MSTIALVKFVYHWFRASTLHDVSPLSSHVVMISLVPLCTQPICLTNGMSYPIAPMIELVWKFLPQWAMSSLMLEFKKVLFRPECPTKKSDMDDREDLLLSTVPIPGILHATWPMHYSSFLVPLFLNLGMRFLLRGRAVTPCVMASLIPSLNLNPKLNQVDNQSLSK
jgi:hypothetical protein